MRSENVTEVQPVNEIRVLSSLSYGQSCVAKMSEVQPVNEVRVLSSLSYGQSCVAKMSQRCIQSVRSVYCPHFLMASHA